MNEHFLVSFSIIITFQLCDDKLNKCIKLYKMKFFSVKLMNIAEDRAVEVSFTITLLIAKNRSAHTTTQKPVKPVSKLITNMLGEKVK